MSDNVNWKAVAEEQKVVIEQLQARLNDLSLQLLNERLEESAGGLDQISQQPQLTVWEGSMPESNGKSNFTALLMRKDTELFDGYSVQIARSEYPDRVRYEADRVRYLIGELKEKPFILDYDADKHSGYTPHK